MTAQCLGLCAAATVVSLAIGASPSAACGPRIWDPHRGLLPYKKYLVLEGMDCRVTDKKTIACTRRDGGDVEQPPAASGYEYLSVNGVPLPRRRRLDLWGMPFKCVDVDPQPATEGDEFTQCTWWYPERGDALP